MKSTATLGLVALAASAILWAGCNQIEGDEAPALSKEASVTLSLNEPVAAGNSERNPADPYLQVAPDGSVFLSWTEQEPGHEHEGRNFLISRLDHTGRMQDKPRRINDQAGEIGAHGGENLSKFTITKDSRVVGNWVQPLSEDRTGIQRGSYEREDGSFSPAVTLNDDGRSLVNHQFSAIATSPDGRIYAAWIDGRNRSVTGYDKDVSKGLRKVYSEDTAQIFMTVSEDGGKTWGKNYPITDMSVCACCRPTFVFLDGGQSVVVSHRAVGEDYLRDQVVRRSDDGGRTFGQPVFISEDGWTNQLCPHSGVSINTDSKGRIHAIWWTGGRTDEEAGIYYNYSEDGGKSFAPRRLMAKTAPAPVLHAQLTVDEDDIIWATWEQVAEKRPQIYLAHGDAESGEWSEYYQLSDGKRNALFPVIAVQGNTVYVAWTERRGEASLVQVRTVELG